ncbi:MAG: aldo/keto reductase [Acidimicrobiia bacterium]
MTPIGLGLAALGRPAYLNLGHPDDLGPDRSAPHLERRTHEVLDAAYAAGVRYVDAARSYGRAEAFLASWFDRRHLSAQAVTVGSKWGYRYVGDWQVQAPMHEIKDHSLAALQRQVAKSRELLAGRLHLYQIHSATPESGVLEDRAVLSELERLREEGLVIGLTVSGPAQAATVRRALAVDVEGANPFRCVQATWNILEPSVGPALAEAHAAGWGVIVKEALANGRLTARSPGPALTVLEGLARRHGVGVDAPAMAAAIAQPWADVVLSGAATVTHLLSNLRALSLELPAGDLDDLSGLAEAPEDYWKLRRALPWQ